MRFMEINPERKVPVFNSGDGKWIAGSDVITQVIEEKYPTPSPSPLSSMHQFSKLSVPVFKASPRKLTSQEDAVTTNFFINLLVQVKLERRKTQQWACTRISTP